jgi:hypothetical protein
MIIENCFAKLKRRWRSLYDMPGYILVSQPTIIMAYCTLHNFIGTHNRNDQIFNEEDAAELEMSEEPIDAGGNDDEASSSHSRQYDFSQAAALEMTNFKDGIAEAMWANTHGHEDENN